MERNGGLPFVSHVDTGKSRLVADLCGEWSRFGSSCLGLARLGVLAPLAWRPVPEGLSRVSVLFPAVFVSGVAEPPLPTLKTGNGESRSWV